MGVENVVRRKKVSQMASHGVGETGFSETGPSSQPLGYGAHAISPAAMNFFDQDGAAYFGELEEALMQGVVGIRGDGERKSFFTSRPPTLDIFPSWPMRFHQTPKGNAQSAESTDSGSAHNTISHLESAESPGSSRMASSELRQQQQQGLVVTSASPRSSTGEAVTCPHRTQEKKKSAGSSGEKDGKILDAKTLRRLAQNREAARKSRLRKKAYVQQLESSRIKLAQLEQDLQRARSQGLILGGGSAGGNISSGAAIFDMEYARWLDENYKHMTELRGVLQAHMTDGELRVIVDGCLTHYDEIFRLKDTHTHITGMWKAEEALSQGLEQLHQSLSETVASGSLSECIDVGNYMGHMAVALEKLANLEGFVRQADNLRQQTVHQLHRILTIRQAARCLLAIGEYHSRLRALSSLWATRPRETLVPDDSNCNAAAELQIIHQPAQSHFSAF